MDKNLLSCQTITMTREEFEKRLNSIREFYSRPRRVHLEDGKLIAGENISMGQLVYLSSHTTKNEVEA